MGGIRGSIRSRHSAETPLSSIPLTSLTTAQHFRTNKTQIFFLKLLQSYWIYWGLGLNKCGELKSVLSGLIVSLRFYFSYWLSCGSLLLCVTGVWQRLLGLTEYFNLWWPRRHCGPGRIKGSHSSLSSERGSIYTNFYSYSSTSSAIPTTCPHPAWAGLPIKGRWVTGQDVKLGVVSMGHQSLNRWKYTSIMDNLCQTS